uniref:Uncharacterized protein n=1 Tax=Pyramimonas obovata TaxID=1411642 RepID=A0A7S0WP39_9CHLO|mmetsp:Transcript_33029/g.72004  ORF Transcript_33029/g.72004 Transcript_33029/m.72004 type:complete len:120 (+) Transcript_33029:151-510(+)|eukprot:CAMPEP_0118935382 /NCGR_PEP_ID=MMETSP1169-20130426/15578_1 /TAXON_ID=36882 /ORGANISM="Pyramimonas obovata, Strain CCMP722" /LENGTH=119 /DNA_ID=CAMNT_0006878409 /DNA_START=151 /DNA_END=510 /DNA_ORIENTATION=+
MAKSKKSGNKASSPKAPNPDNTPSLEEIEKMVAEVEAETSGQPTDQAAHKDSQKHKKEKYDGKTQYIAGLVTQVQSEVYQLRVESAQVKTSLTFAALGGVVIGAAMASVVCVKLMHPKV